MNLKKQCLLKPNSFYIEKASQCLKLAVKYMKINSKQQLELLSDQVKLISLKQKRYALCSNVFAFKIFSSSPLVYFDLREYLSLPHLKYLQHLASPLISSTNSNDEGSQSYLRLISKHLSEQERYVSILINEIYIKSVGYAMNNENLTKTVLTFMIRTCFDKFYEVVRLCPVKGLFGDYMKSVIFDTVHYIQQNNFKVLAVITDNNKVNQRMYNIITDDSILIKNSLYEELLIFLHTISCMYLKI